jgi:hypothetical protein
MLDRPLTPYALLMCENILTDVSGRRTFYNIFTGMATKSLPAKLPRLAVVFMARVSDSPTQITLRIVGEDEKEVVKQAATLSRLIPDDEDVEFGLVLDGATFQNYGSYRVQVLAQDGTIVFERPLHVRTTSPGGAGGKTEWHAGVEVSESEKGARP